MILRTRIFSLQLRRHEEIVYSERKKREIELQQTKREADEKKMHHEKIERRLVSFLFACRHIIDKNSSIDQS